MTERNAWRVTDPNAVKNFEAAREFLPNPVIPFRLSDLEKATRAEIVIDRWGGHTGTAGKRIRFNRNTWIPLPELIAVPEGQDPLCYMYQDNPVVQVPLEHLKEGSNTLEGMADNQVCHSFNWGQWGWYGAILRVYYPAAVAHPEARLIAPLSGAVLGENPVVQISIEGSPVPVDRVDILALYEGFDEDGDGLFYDWHGHYRYSSLTGHVGTVVPETSEQKTLRLKWDTKLVPDQPEGSLRLLARVRGENGVWWVTGVNDGLALERSDSEVQFFKAEEVPESFWVRDGARESCLIPLPAEVAERDMEDLWFHLRAWNGDNHGTGTLTRINSWEGSIPGVDHNYTCTAFRLPASAVKAGSNKVEFFSATHHHGVELLWPGPGLTIRFRKAPK